MFSLLQTIGMYLERSEYTIILSQKKKHKSYDVLLIYTGLFRGSNPTIHLFSKVNYNYFIDKEKLI